MRIPSITITAAALVLAVPVGSATADVVLINIFEVPVGARDEAVAAWRTACDFLSAEPGYVSTTLHEAVTADAQFALVNVAVWDSAETFVAASARMRAAGTFNPPEGVVAWPALYRVIHADTAGSTR